MALICARSQDEEHTLTVMALLITYTFGSDFGH